MRWLRLTLVWVCWGSLAFAQQETQSKTPAENHPLIKYFQDRSLTEAEEKVLKTHIRKLGSNSFRERTQATKYISQVGTPAIQFLEDSLNEKDQEIARRAEFCLALIQQQNADITPILEAVTKIGKSFPPGTNKVLLEYLPFAPEEEIISKVQKVLTQVVKKNGPDSVLLQAVHAPNPIVRASAGVALSVNPQLRPILLKLLNDPDPTVRLQVSLALIEQKEKKALPVLIELLESLPANKSWQAEYLLCRLAGETAPSVTFNGANQGKKIRSAWENWHKKNASKLDQYLDRLSKSPKLLNRTLITQMSLRGGTNGQILELGPTKKVLWKIENLRYPVDAQVVAPNRVLVAEYLSHRVSERDFKGKVVWQTKINLPICCQRLPNGHTFIGSRTMVLEVDRNGKEVYSRQIGGSIRAARKLVNGHIIVIDNAGQLIEIDRNGKKVRSFNAGRVYSLGGTIDVLANGRILIPHYRTNKVVEYTPDGKEVWSVNVTYPTSAMRLPNGNTLVVSMTKQRVLEFDRNGRQVWQYATKGRPWRARRR